MCKILEIFKKYLCTTDLTDISLDYCKKIIKVDFGDGDFISLRFYDCGKISIRSQGYKNAGVDWHSIELIVLGKAENRRLNKILK